MEALLGCKSVHTSKALWLLNNIAEDHVIVTPLRDPRNVWKSWERRNNKLSRHFMQQWNTLKNFDANCYIFYVPVDREEKHECIQELSKKLGRKLSPDWDIYIGCDHEPARLPYHAGVDPLDEVGWKYLYNLPMIKRFYTDNG